MMRRVRKMCKFYDRKSGLCTKEKEMRFHCCFFSSMMVTCRDYKEGEYDAESQA
jgi:hypothetical protein